MVKSESAASMAAVCPGGSTVPATVMIVVEYRLIYQLIVVGGHLARAAKALVVSELIAIFHPRDGKS